MLQSLYPHCAEYQLKESAIQKRARDYISIIREKGLGAGVEGFMQQYRLNTQEGIAVMCLAEALVRIPDVATADALIEDSFHDAQWEKHLGKSESLFINASTWGLLLTGKIFQWKEHQGSLRHLLGSLTARVGEPIIRQALKQAVHFLGKQFVLGRTVEEALSASIPLAEKGYNFSYDMLGEGARSMAQAERYFQSYLHAIRTVGARANKQGDILSNQGISIKLSALHPRYEWRKQQRVMDELLPRLITLLTSAAEHNIAVALDAEESWRLDISLQVFSALATHVSLRGYEGLGFVVQAYQKRALPVLEYLTQLAQQRKLRMPVRLVKGAYWDGEIKYAQLHGLQSYPVFTRKSHTDISYLACVSHLLEKSQYFYPQFATHNALTAASIMEVAGDKPFEFQRLYGMGEAFYEQQVGKQRVRIYAPVGSHEELLPYLIRRLLENGANSSFVHQVADKNVPIDALLDTPFARALRPAVKPLPLPKNIYAERENPEGIDIGNRAQMEELQHALEPYHGVRVEARKATTSLQMQQVLEQAHHYFPEWNKRAVTQRAEMLQRAADALDKHRHEVITLLMDEAGKTLLDAVNEVREAIDFCRYYAVQACALQSKPMMLPRITGEQNQLYLHGRGVFVCIAPWNFPLAIFLGQVAAALVTGNTVIAKPAEQTQMIASMVVRMLHQAGVPQEALHLVLARGREVSDHLLSDARVAGVAFTGSTQTAQAINLQLARRNNAPLANIIAETGGQNAMIVDSTCQLEQTVDDVMHSAFYSAGQRCSALRVLYVQEDIVEAFITLLQGAMQELQLGTPQDFTTDIAYVIDMSAKEKLQQHIARMEKEGSLIAKVVMPDNVDARMVAPHAFEIQSISQLPQEVFGPILHVIRYAAQDLPTIYSAMNSTGYGLTAGLQSRIHQRMEAMCAQVQAGNIYINRGMTGAVVGQQPFGGMGLSGTGFKAGGPHYLLRFMHEQTVTINTAAVGGNLELLS